MNMNTLLFGCLALGLALSLGACGDDYTSQDDAGTGATTATAPEGKPATPDSETPDSETPAAQDPVSDPVEAPKGKFRIEYYEISKR